MFDFSRVLLHPTDKTYSEGLNKLYKQLRESESFYLFNHFELNEEILEFLKTLNGKFELCIFTTDIIQNDPLIREKIDPAFSKIFSANELGISKKDPSSYKFIADTLGVKPEEIFFTDDTEANLEAAKEAGIKTHQYKTNKDLINLLKTLNE